jgi:hypothetical protein
VDAGSAGHAGDVHAIVDDDRGVVGDRQLHDRIAQRQQRGR